MITRPMLAAKIDDMSKLRFPLIATPKLDGIRCVMVNGRALTRTFKPIPNEYIRRTLEDNLPDGMDGEIIAGSTFQQTTSAVMSHDGTPAFTYHVFDRVVHDLNERYIDRIRRLEYEMKIHHVERVSWVRFVEYAQISDMHALRLYIEQMKREGQEGACFRHPDSPYKCGRATFREHYLLKLKFFEDSEARIVGFEEAMENLNPKETNELGLTKRSSHKDNKQGKGMAGKIRAVDVHTGQEIVVGTGIGLTHDLRLDMWLNPEAYVGRVFKYQYQAVGTKDSPRIPSFQGWRDERDM